MRMPFAFKPETKTLFQNRPFRNYLTGNSIFIFGMQMQSLIVSWHAYSLTHNPFSLGLIGISEAIPFIITSLIGGYLADTMNRKRMILLSVLGFLLTAILLFGISFLNEKIDDGLEINLLYAAIFCTGICRGFMAPAKSSLMADLLNRSLYLAGSTWYSIFWQSAAILGPAFGGLIFAWFGQKISYFIVVLLTGLGYLFFTLVVYQNANPSQKTGNFFKELRKGFAFVYQQKIMLSAITLDMFAVLFGGAIALLPAFAQDILKTGPDGLGLLRMSPSAGAVLMGLVLTRVNISKHSGYILLASVIGFGAATLGFALSTHFWLSWVFLFLTGAFDSVSVVIRSTIMQLFTPDEMRGKVSSINSIFISTSNEIGAFESGLAARFLGLVNSVVFGGCMTIAITIGMGLASGKLRRLKLNKL